MNIDFHYYGTYLAARISGFPKKDAETIAYAAQFVDDFRQPLAPAAIGDTPIQETSEKIDIISYQNLFPADRPDGPYYESSRIWVCYHFLPGNYGEDAVDYLGEYPFDVQNVDSWNWEAKSQNQFKLACRTDSSLVGVMMNDVIANRSDGALHALGLRLHVLEDTYSHEYFSGKPFRFTNDFIGGKITELDDAGKEVGSSTMPGSPALAVMNAMAYLGHARLGHYPDQSYAHYKYTPRWSAVDREKNNQKDYLLAFRQVLHALKCYCDETEFRTRVYADLSSAQERQVAYAIANARGDNPESVWVSAIESLGYEKPIRYAIDSWVNKYKKGDAEDLRRFNQAAHAHYLLVRDELKKQNIYFDQQPPAALTGVRLRNKDYVRGGRERQYIGGGGESNSNILYPIVSDKKYAYEFNIINYTGAPLASGDVVDIALTKPVGNGISYLAQRNSASREVSIFLQYAEYQYNRQTWTVVRADGKRGEIRKGDEIHIKNCYYTGKPFLCPDEIFRAKETNLKVDVSANTHPSWVIE